MMAFIVLANPSTTYAEVSEARTCPPYFGSSAITSGG